MKRFAERLQRLCLERGVSAAQAAAVLGWTTDSYARFLAGEREPLACQLVAAARYFGVSTDYLAGLTENPALSECRSSAPAPDEAAALADEAEQMYSTKPASYYAGANPYLFKHVQDGWREVLDVGCSAGGLGALMKDKGIRVSGIEGYPEAAAKARRKLDHVLTGSIETLPLPYRPGQFDCIVFGDVLEHLVDPWAVLGKVRPFLQDKGTVLASIPNVGHMSVLAPLLAGRFAYEDQGLMDRTHLRFFTRTEIVLMFESCGYRIREIERVHVAFEVYRALMVELAAVCLKHGLGSSLAEEGNAYQYVIVAERTD